MAKTVWIETANGYKAKLAEGALTLFAFYDDGWRSGINDRVVKHTYEDAASAKKATISWAKEKLKMMESQLRDLEQS